VINILFENVVDATNGSLVLILTPRGYVKYVALRDLRCQSGAWTDSSLSPNLALLGAMFITPHQPESPDLLAGTSQHSGLEDKIDLQDNDDMA
jgi:hypothetical protein